MACNIVESDFCPGEWNIGCLAVGSTIKRTWVAEMEDGTPIDLSGDTFSTIVLDSNGDEVIGAITNTITGVNDNELNFMFNTALTNNAGAYTFKTWWLRPATSENFPAFSGTITVE